MRVRLGAFGWVSATLQWLGRLLLLAVARGLVAISATVHRAPAPSARTGAVDEQQRASGARAHAGKVGAGEQLDALARDVSECRRRGIRRDEGPVEVLADLRGGGWPACPLVHKIEVRLGRALAAAGTVEYAVGRLPQVPRQIKIVCAHARPFGEHCLAQPLGEVRRLGEPLDPSTWAIADGRDELQRDVA